MGEQVVQGYIKLACVLAVLLAFIAGLTIIVVDSLTGKTVPNGVSGFVWAVLAYSMHTLGINIGMRSSQNSGNNTQPLR
jgi:hypothetical protein